MLRLLTCALHIFFGLAADGDAPFSASPPSEHRRILECTARESADTCCSEEISLIQKHASVHWTGKANRAPRQKPAVRYSPEDAPRLYDEAGELSSEEAVLPSHEGEVRVLRQHLLVLAMLVITVSVLGGAFCHYFDPKQDDGQPDDETEEVEVLRNEELPADTLGFLVSAMVRDAESVLKGESAPYSRIFRTCLAVFIFSLNIFLQVYLFFYILSYVVPEAVAGIRETYESYEAIMYENHTDLSVTGEIRGMDGYFQPAQFQALDDDLKASVCTIPFSQPWFFIPLLFIWTLSCVREVKSATDLLYLLVIRMPSVSSMTEALETRKELSGVRTRRELTQGKDLNVKVIMGLTPRFKSLICFGIIVPRICITCFLCWLGSRWLAAASDFGNLVLDTVAVEFMLLLKNLLYMTLISDRNKRDLHHTEIRPPSHTEKATFWVYMCSAFWVVVALGWVILYCCYFQMVLLDYRWDVREVCTQWITSSYPASIV